MRESKRADATSTSSSFTVCSIGDEAAVSCDWISSRKCSSDSSSSALSAGMTETDSSNLTMGKSSWNAVVVFSYLFFNIKHSKEVQLYL